MSNGQMHTCDTCFKSFSRRGDLTRHSYIHAGYKPHKCSDCGKCFSQYSGLKTHRNVHTKVKPYTCEIDGCKAAFGDPSSRARHCKETHRTVGAFRCPVSRCKSSIKRRSAFTQHLRKHGIDPESINIDALAPALIPRPAPYQRKSLRSVQAEPSQDSKTPAAEQRAPPTLSVSYLRNSFFHQFDGPTGPVLHSVEQLTDGQGSAIVMHGGWPQGAIELPSLPESGIFTIDMAAHTPVLPTEGLLSFDSPSFESPTPLHAARTYLDSPMSNPGLCYSTSPSPSPPQNLLHPEYNFRGLASSSPCTPSPLPLQQSSLLFFSDPTTSYAAHNGRKPLTEWDFESSVFEESHELEFHGVHV